MISSGEDNIGQILLALYSFKKLKDTFPEEYKGGILIIDEIDASLYPAAQNKLLDIILEKSRVFGIQVFATTHSLSLLDYIDFLKHDNNKNNAEIAIFLNQLDKHDTLSSKRKEYIYELKNELLVKPNPAESVNKINIYYEDEEAKYIFNNLLPNSLRTRLKHIKVTLSCSKYKELYTSKIPEFEKNSVICVDGDQPFKVNRMKNFIELPLNKKNPERFIFELLSDSSSSYWEQAENYTHSVFMNNKYYGAINSIINGTYEEEYKAQTKSEHYNRAPREIWKKWFQVEKQNWKGKNNPIKFWANSNENCTTIQNFENDFKQAFNFVAKNNRIEPLEQADQ